MTNGLFRPCETEPRNLFRIRLELHAFARRTIAANAGNKPIIGPKCESDLTMSALRQMIQI